METKTTTFIMEQNRIDAIKTSFNNYFNLEDLGDVTTLRGIYDGQTVDPVMAERVLHMITEAEEDEDVQDFLASVTKEEMAAAIKEIVDALVEEKIDEEKEELREAVSDWFSDHCGRYDFDSARDRLEYLEDLANGNGDIDYIYDSVIDDFEYTWMSDEELDKTFDEAVESEADYYYSTARWDD